MSYRLNSLLDDTAFGSKVVGWLSWSFLSGQDYHKAACREWYWQPKPDGPSLPLFQTWEVSGNANPWVGVS